MDTIRIKDNKLSRRRFLRNSAALAGGAYVSTLPISASAYVAGSDTLRLALIGCGARGTGAVVQALRTNGPVELVAMADIFREQVDSSYANLLEIEDIRDSVKVPEDRKFVGFDAYKKAIAEADVVIQATPPAFRPEHFEAAIQAGKHVFMEKPLSSDAPGIRKLLAAGKLAEEKNLSVVVGLQTRYAPEAQELVKRLSDGAIGDIVSVKTNYLTAGLEVHPRKPGQSELEFQLRNWHYFTWLWAGAPAGLMIHYTDVVHWAKGSYPVRAHGIGGRAALHSSDHGDIFDHFYIEYEYEDGTRLNSETRMIDGCWRDTGIEFKGARGKAHLSNWHLSSKGIMDLKGETLWKYREQNPPNPFQLEHDAFVASIREGKPINDTERGAMSSMTSILGRMAVHSGQLVEWEEAFNSDLKLVPENMTFDSEPPVRPDEHGRYPIPIPGKAKAV